MTPEMRFVLVLSLALAAAFTGSISFIAHQAVNAPCEDFNLKKLKDQNEVAASCINVSGYPLPFVIYSETIRKSNTVEKTEIYIPLVEDNWTIGKKVNCLLYYSFSYSIEDLNDPDRRDSQNEEWLYKLLYTEADLQLKNFTAVVSPPLIGESVTTEVRANFLKEFDLQISEDVIVLEPERDKYLFYLLGAGVSTIVFLILVGYFLFTKPTPKAKASVSVPAGFAEVKRRSGA